MATPSTFGYSARALFGKDHHRVSPERDSVEHSLSMAQVSPGRGYESPKTADTDRELSDGVKKLLKYICVLQAASGKQFDNVLGRLHWMLKTTGCDLDQEDEESMDEAFDILRDMALDNTYSKSSRWKIMELLELRASNWENSEAIAEYYEDPANFMVEHETNNNTMKMSQNQVPLSAHLSYNPGHRMLYITNQPHVNSQGPISPSSTTSPESFHTESRNGSLSYMSDISGSSRSRNTSGGSNRSRNASGGSSGMQPLRRPSIAGSGLSKQSKSCTIEEDVFHDAEDRSTDESTTSSRDSDASSSSGGDVVENTPSLSTANYRLMQINSGKPIKYTRNFLLGCWASPHCKVMPSSLQHTISNSDIAYIISGPPFESPINLVAKYVVPTTRLIGPPVRRSFSLPAEPTSPTPASTPVNNTVNAPKTGCTMDTNPLRVPSPMHVPTYHHITGTTQVYTPDPRTIPVFARTMSSPAPVNMRGTSYYKLPTGIHKGILPGINKDAFHSLFKQAIRQIDSNQQKTSPYGI